jgi:hypothetical protein
MKRITIGAVVLAFAASVSSLVAAGGQAPTGLDDDAARMEAASYLASSPTSAEKVAERWVVTDGADRAWLDTRTGELVEIEFAPAR